MRRWSTVLRRCRFLVVEKLESKKTDVERLAALTRCALEAAGVESLTVGKRGKAAADLLLQDALGAQNDMKDLVDWLGKKRAKRALGDARNVLAETAAEALEARRVAARDLVLEEAPGLIAQLDRSAGVIGPVLR